MYVGKTFSTGNSVINGLPVGSKLEVTGKGTVIVREIPKPVVFEEGDIIYVVSKDRKGKVVRITDNGVIGNPVGFNPQTQVLYIGVNGEPPVIRVANKADCKNLSR